MKYLTFVFLFVILRASGQDFALENAINAYKINNLKVANRQITNTTLHPKTSRLPKTWKYYFFINERNYNSSISSEDSLSNIYEMIKGYNQYVKFQTDNKLMIDSLGTILYDKSLHYQSIVNDDIINKNPEKYLTALKVYTSVLEVLDLHSGKDYYFVAQANNQQKKYDTALDFYEKSMSLGYKLEECYTAIIEILITQRNNDKVNDLIQEAILLFPNNKSFILIEVKRLVNNELYFRGKKYLIEVIAKHKDFAPFYYYLGKMNEEMMMEDEAILAYQRACQLDKYHINANLELGKYWLSKGKSDANNGMLLAAKTYLEKADSIQPTNKNTIGLLKDLYLSLNDKENYEKILNKEN